MRTTENAASATPAGRTDFTFTKIDVQFMRRECNRILKELEENK